MRLFLCLFMSAIVFVGCNNSQTNENEISEGTIIYDITYNKEKVDNLLLAFLPKTMELSFKKNKVKSQITGAFNMFSLTNYSNKETDVNSTSLIIGDECLIYHEAMDTSTFGHANMPFFEDLTLIVDSTYDIAGYRCQKALLKFNEGVKKMPVFYTPKIKICENFNRPNKEIHGALMKFNVDIFSIEAHFVAKEVKAQKIDDAIFNLPENCKKVKKDDLEGVIKKMMN